MKTRSLLNVTIVVCLVFFSVAAWAQEDTATKKDTAIKENTATKEECVAKVTEVAKLIKAKGFEAVAPKFKSDGPYVWKSDGYVFCMDTKEGIFIAHPFLPPQLMGRPMLGVTDSNGKPFVKEMLDLANKEGKGWVTYMARRRGFREPQLKEAYLLKVPEAEIIVSAGYFPKKK